MRRPGPVSSRLAFDVLVVAVAVSALGTALRQTSLHTDAWMWTEAVVVALSVLALLGRRRFPFAAPATIWLVCPSLSFVDGALIANQPALFLAGVGAALLLGNLKENVKALVGLVLVVAGAAVIVQNQPAHLASQLVFTPMVFAISWLAGYSFRERSEQAQAAEERAARALREREAATRLAVAEERAKIARELHDIVAHALSVMVLQVGVVRRRRPPTEVEDREALENVEQVGRAALTEMRRLLNAMRGRGDRPELGPHPGLRDLDALLDEVRSTGLDVRLHVTGDRFDLSPVLDLSAYRIVQEGLTNTIKHAQAKQADVELRYGAQDVVVEVSDDGLGGRSVTRSNGPSNGMGHGLVGIRERVTIFGGEMSAGPRNNGHRGFVLRARLPVGEDQS